MATPDREDLRAVLTATAVALERAEVPFAVGGGYAAWARGAPEPEHDADLLVAAEDVERAADAVTAAGLHVARALREQGDWAQVRRTVGDSPCAAAFPFLTDRLGISGG